MPKARAHKHPNKYVWSIPQALYICSDVCEILTVSIQDTSQDGQKPKKTPLGTTPLGTTSLNTGLGSNASYIVSQQMPAWQH